MKIAEFDYRDSKGKESHRNIVVLSGKQDHVLGIDYTELTTEDAAEFLWELDMLKELHKYQQDLLLEQFDIKGKYRRFTPTQMFNIKVEEV